MPIISYAQVKEDVLLYRALRTVPSSDGFYIDIGANDPDANSVTKLFYDRGWRGINVEPSPGWFEVLTRARARDVNIQAAVSNEPGEVTFHDDPGGQLGTVVAKFASRLVETGIATSVFTVPALTLTEICERHAPRDIHFLKVDVEGHEGKVLEGMDFKRFRPWILVVEATEPRALHVPTYHEWDQLVLDAGYRFAYTDVLNRYYVALEHAELAAHFAVPADDYVLAQDAGHVTVGALNHCFYRLHQDMQELRDAVGGHVAGLTALASYGSIKLHDEVRGVLGLLRPHAVERRAKARFGAANDGGYVLVDDFGGVGSALSIGLGKSAQWDAALEARGLSVARYELQAHAGGAPPALAFAAPGAPPGPGEGIASLAAKLGEEGRGTCGILRIDLGNDTWQALDEIPDHALSNVAQLVCELHCFEHLADPAWRRLAERVLRRLASSFAVVHVHANNFAGMSAIANVPVPHVLQVTFANKMWYSVTGTDEVFPGPLDAPCDPGRPDVCLGSFRF